MSILRRVSVPSLCASALCWVVAAVLEAQTPDTSHAAARPRMQAAERTSPITLDGRLDESAWAASTPATGFRQSEPNEGQPATQPTEVRILYDDAALYIGARMFDSLGARGVRTYLSRRDQQEDGDYLELIFDTFHDHTGRTVFQINPSAVKTDAGQASSNADPSWDPIWEVATSIDSLGWVAEIRIPFAQLRFSRDIAQSWGLQVWRYVERIRETSMWSFWKRNESGGPPMFGHVDGIRVTERPRGIELLPYVVSRAAYVPIRDGDQGNPFRDPSEYTVRVGGDFKALLTSNLTLDLTVNPDFGQVEVDPAVVNLTAFETSFSEKRPFFVEGSGLFGFGGLNCYFCSNVSSMSLYYSRRIGRQPRGSPPEGYAYLDRPDNATILGAAKITGRTRGGYQVGLLDAVTKSENADIAFDDDRRRTSVHVSTRDVLTRLPGEREVEPLTNYFVGRVKKNFAAGRGFLGAIATSTVRRFGEDYLRLAMPSHSEAVGVDWEHWWKNRTYRIMSNAAVSNVSGDPMVIRSLQEQSARYFNRPDRAHGDNGLFSDRYDATLTSLRGYGGYVRASKESGDWLFESSVNVRSPGFEVNDLAFLTRADYVWMNANVFRQWQKPTKRYRQAYWIAGGQQQYNFDGDRTDLQLQNYVEVQLPNYWWVNSGQMYRAELFDDRWTRGGPVVKRAAKWIVFANLSTDSRKRVSVSLGPEGVWNDDGGRSYSLFTEVRLKPASNVVIEVEPYYSYNGGKDQFVPGGSFTDTTANHFYDRRVIFSDIEQHTLELGTRLNVTFTPTLTLELFAQPLIASGDYENFKEFVAPRTVEKRVFDATQLTRQGNNYVLDADRNPLTPALTFSNPDFNFRSLRGNAVLRWEYRPGSTVFLVWTQSRSSEESVGDFRFSRDRSALFDAKPDNVFLIKVNYWIGL